MKLVKVAKGCTIQGKKVKKDAELTLSDHIADKLITRGLAKPHVEKAEKSNNGD